MLKSRTLALVVIGASLAAQQNPFVVFPQDPVRQAITCGSYVRRPNWNLQAEGFQELAAAWFRGIGDTGTACSVRGFYFFAADENIATAETYGIVLRTADPTGAPDVTATGVITRVTGLTTPTGGGGPRGTWIMTDVFATPVAVPCAQGWFQGLDLPANPNWPTTDGLSLWAADALGAGSPATVGENHRVGAPNVTWSVDTVLGTAISRPWDYIIGAYVDAPVLHLGGIDPLSSRTGALGAPSYGMNGLFPEIPTHGMNVRVQDGTTQGIAIVAGALGYFPQPINFPLGGRYYLDLGTTVVIGFANLANGAATVPIAAPGTIPAAMVGLRFIFQGAVINSATGAGRFSNAQTTLF